MDHRAERFAELQARALLPAWRAAVVGSGHPHVTIALPSYSLGGSALDHYAERLPALENRYLHSVLLARQPRAHVVFLSSAPVPDAVLDGYLGLVPESERQAVGSRIHLITVDERSTDALATKLLRRPDALAEVRRLVAAHGPGLIEPWNVTAAERDLALALDVPLFGCAPELRTLATKSAGRRMMRAAGVEVPRGHEDVVDVDGLVAAVRALEADGGAPAGVVAKLDDSVAGDGNVCLPHGLADDELLARLPDWWVAELALGGVVEERIAGRDFRSPSCQANLSPDGSVTILATHEQRLGGPDGQVYEGCTFPADAAYATLLGRCAQQVGSALAAAGALGRFAIDFVVCRDETGGWVVQAVEINLRKGGTTHPNGLVRLLTGAVYDSEAASMTDAAGQTWCYASTDNLVDDRWRGRTPADVQRRLAEAGLAFSGAGRPAVVPHLLDCLPVDGRMGYTVLAHDHDQVAELEERALAVLRG